ncbi:MAG: hypothetical protein Kow0025_01720 [Thermodesulfovibrionales bacterium]
MRRATITGIVLIAAAALALAACAGTPRVYTQAPEAEGPPAGVAVLGHDCGVSVESIDGRETGFQGAACWGESYVSSPVKYYLSPGKHRVRIIYRESASYTAREPAEIEVEAVEGHTYHIRANLKNSGWEPYAEDLAGKGP